MIGEAGKGGGPATLRELEARGRTTSSARRADFASDAAVAAASAAAAVVASDDASSPALAFTSNFASDFAPEFAADSPSQKYPPRDVRVCKVDKLLQQNTVNEQR